MAQTPLTPPTGDQPVNDSAAVEPVEATESVTDTTTEPTEEAAGTQEPEAGETTEVVQEQTAPAPAPAESGAQAPAPAETPLDPAELEAAAAFGRVDGDGTVYVQDESGERAVGQFPDAPATEAMTFYIRRYLDLAAQVRLFASRIPILGAKDLNASLAHLREQVKEPQAVGDLADLRRRVALIEEQVAARLNELQIEREAAREAALARREEIVAAAEAVAGQDTTRTQWKDSGERLHQLLEEWKSAQRQGPRLDKATEDVLWKRFSKARTVFDKNRRQFFADRDASYEAAKAAKEALIARAEELSTSTDWGRTAGEYRSLMTEWKAAGRARRKDDDALWTRFRAASQAFFDARDAQNQQMDAEYGANLQVKLAILEEAEKLVPVKDAKAARAALRQLGEKWDAAGRVPRSEMAKVEGRMRAVEQAVKEVEDAEWHRTNPETTARVNSATAQLEASIAALEADLEKATAAGDQKAIKAANDALEARRAWLTQIQSL